MKPRQIMAISSILIVTIVIALVWRQSADPGTVNLTMATGPKDGTFHALGQEIKEIVHQSDANISIRLTEDSAGSDDNRDRLIDGRADLAIVQNDTEPRGDVQTLLPLHRGACHFLVHQDSTITNIYDLRGKTVAVGQKNSGNLHIVRELLKHFGVWEGDHEFTPVYEGISECGLKLENREIDAALIITAISSKALTELVKRGQVRYVSLAAAGQGNEIDGFAVTYPYIEKFTIPRYVYPVHDMRRGLPIDPCESFALRSTLVCRGDLPDEVARTIVESVITNRAKIMRAHHEARDISEHFDPAEIQFPIHHGAMAFYQRQRPGFLERYSEPMAFILSLCLAVCGMMAAFNKWLMLHKKNRIDQYYERLDGLLTELNTEHPSRQRLESIEQELLSMRHDAVRELVKERLLADGSFQIFQSLLTDCHHQLSLQRGSKLPSDS